jgi:molecular chaperone GrpE
VEKDMRKRKHPEQAEEQAKEQVPEHVPDQVSEPSKSVGDLEAKVSALGAQVSELEAQLAEAAGKIAAASGERDAWQSKATAIYDQYLRVKSDFDGYRKRTERDFDDRLTREKAGFLRAVLEVMDNFERFLHAAEETGPEGGERGFDAFFKGVDMVRKQLMDTLLKEGVEPVEDPVGKQLDPNFHDAVAAQDGGGERGTVVEEVQRGYMYKGLVLRPARVKAIR